MMVFFSGGVSSELYVLFFPLLLASALHGSWRITLAALFAVLFCYALAVMPGLLNDTTDNGVAALVFYRLVCVGLTGVFLVSVARSFLAPRRPRTTRRTRTARCSWEGRGRARGAQGGAGRRHPGRPGTRVEDVELLLERVRARIGEPILLGEGSVFGVVLSGVDDRTVESAARRALAAASSLGAEETRAGAAIYPRDARSAEDLLVAAGQALEAAFEVESPSAIVFAGRGAPGAPRRSLPRRPLKPASGRFVPML